MVILWKKDSLVINYSLIGPSFIGINILWYNYGVNLCSVNLRKDLWYRLLDRRDKGMNEE